MKDDLEKYLEDINFDKQFKKLVKKLKNKKVIIYGIGKLYKLIKSKYDLSQFNIVAVCDTKFTRKDENTFDSDGIKKVLPYKLVEIDCDYILISALRYLNIIKNIETEIENTKIKVLPLAPIPKLSLIKELLRGGG